MGETVDVKREGAVATVVMHRGGNNAIAPDLVDELTAAFEELAGDDGVRCIVLASEYEKYFSVGADLTAMGGSVDREAPDALDRMTDAESEGIGVRVLVGGAWGFACDRRLTEEGARNATTRACTFARAAAGRPECGRHPVVEDGRCGGLVVANDRSRPRRAVHRHRQLVHRTGRADERRHHGHGPQDRKDPVVESGDTGGRVCDRLPAR